MWPIDLSRSHGNEGTEALDVKLYNERIPVEKKPKFLGIIFDRRLTFDKHFELIDLKLIDRLNILKILSYDQNWRLDTTTLIRIYKSLVRFENSTKFKEKKALNINLAVDSMGVVDLETLNFIRAHNKKILTEKEVHPTTLCGASVIIRNFLLDDFTVGGTGDS